MIRQPETGFPRAAWVPTSSLFSAIGKLPRLVGSALAALDMTLFSHATTWEEKVAEPVI